MDESIVCNDGIVTLVVILFVSGYILFNSLLTGISTTQLIVRVATNKCKSSRLAERLRGIRKRRRAQKWSPAKLFLVKYCIPFNALSRAWGMITRVYLPFYWMRFVVYMGWTKMYGCNLKEAKYPIGYYSSLSKFFLRPLKDGSRKIDNNNITSPCDGRVLHMSSVPLGETMFIEQIKGVTYKFNELVGPVNIKKNENRMLQSIVIYLAPGDYHYFHSPVEWKCEQRRHFPGNLLPVRKWAVENVQGLYCSNERVALNGKWKDGFFSLVAVGALNVGSIDLEFEPNLKTNIPNKRYSENNYTKPIKATNGQLLGDFNLGSTVVLLFETDKSFKFNCQIGQKLNVGQSLSNQTNTKPVVLAPPWPQA